MQTNLSVMVHKLNMQRLNKQCKKCLSLWHSKNLLFLLDILDIYKDYLLVYADNISRLFLIEHHIKFCGHRYIARTLTFNK